MRILKVLATSLGLSVALVGLASAADLDASISDEQFEQRWSWSGVNVGVDVGHSWQSDTTGNRLLCFKPSCEAEGEGTVYGAFFGYTEQFSNGFTVGAEASYTHHGVMFTDGSQVEIRDAFAFTGKLGFAVDRIHAFGILGAVYGRTDAPIPALADSDWGMIYGAGIDVGITQNIFAGVQFTRQDYDDFADVRPFGLDADIDAKVDTLKFRVGYKF